MSKFSNRSSFEKSVIFSVFSLGLTFFTPYVEATCFSSMPTSVPLINSNFGMRFHPKLKFVRRHDGTDFRARPGVALFSVYNGKALTSWSNSAGNMVRLLAEDGSVVHYFHLERFSVTNGQTVTAGQQLGESGNTGSASGPHAHLHLETIPKGGAGSKDAVDARQFLCKKVNEQPDAGPDPKLNPGSIHGGPVGTGESPKTPTNPTNPGSPAAPGTPGSPAPGTGGVGSGTPTIKQPSEMGSFDEMSMHEFLSAESTRRFANPQWYRDINDPLDSLRNNPDPAVRATVNEIPMGSIKPMLWREILFMMTLKNIYQGEKQDRKERIEQMLASDLADRVSEYSIKLLGALRANINDSK